MNLTALRTATTVAKKAYGSYADYRDRKAKQAYEALVDAANTYNVQGLIDESTQRFNTLSEKALKRIDDVKSEMHLDKATERATDKIAELGEKAHTKTAAFKKQQAKKAKAAKKQAKKLARKEKRGKKLLTFGLAAAIAAALGGAIYYLFGLGQGKKQYDTEPPKVDDYAAEESRLVYSTATPAEGAPERDEELLDALEEQLAKHSDAPLDDDAEAAAKAKEAEELELKLERKGKK
ncbi:hypothetical protein CMUST_00155 [Corynebacterium mustelae]|uniref:Uncharacterized protein n=1 Tax=Corynebacterium mustelae TaxID=571915 RepID=A0A0G3GV44_9CORY|nr:hypothetical protein [Corynebacterium mustelae]AKK04390.1 hypothetical protein CMUST_00155 [Corynebacterium mustelae]